MKRFFPSILALALLLAGLLASVASAQAPSSAEGPAAVPVAAPAAAAPAAPVAPAATTAPAAPAVPVLSAAPTPADPASPPPAPAPPALAAPPTPDQPGPAPPRAEKEEAAPPEGHQGIGAILGNPIVMMLLMFGVIYFMLIRPQSKKRKEHQSWLDGLQRGDTVVTQGGIIGKITGVADKVVTIEVAHDVRMRVLRSHILGPESMASSSQGREEAKPQQKAK